MTAYQNSIDQASPNSKTMLRAINALEPYDSSNINSDRFKTALDHKIVRNINGPALFLSRKTIRENLRALKSALPGVSIHYAVKANDHPDLLKTVAEEGHRFDICSAVEIDKAAQAGANPIDLIHTHPIKSNQEIQDAINKGVRTFLIDNPDEIAKFDNYRDKVKLLVRFRAVSSAESAAAVQCNLSFKFGCAPQEIEELVNNINIRGIDFAGLAFHVGSQCLAPDLYLKGINIAANVISKLQTQGIDCEILDIGGGFPVEYVERVPDIETFCRPIRKALSSLIPPRVKMISEPGRYISASAVTLLVNVIGKSVRDGRPWYYLDDGLYGSFSGRLYDHCSYQALTNRNTTWVKSTLAGPTCDSIDVIYDDILLPPLQIGDTLVFPVMGAYCQVSASRFNSLRQAETIVVD
ncbi:MAG: type III PLP-dependent enzyme [candidate division Zixibacteria bacterium]|nr:type III PLP-dependent enzyme [candidate division Zixibacteria bacterium]